MYLTPIFNKFFFKINFYEKSTVFYIKKNPCKLIIIYLIFNIFFLIFIKKFNKIDNKENLFIIILFCTPCRLCSSNAGI